MVSKGNLLNQISTTNQACLQTVNDLPYSDSLTYNMEMYMDVPYICIIRPQILRLLGDCNYARDESQLVDRV